MKQRWKLELEGHRNAPRSSSAITAFLVMMAMSPPSIAISSVAVSRLPGDLHVTSGHAVLSLYAGNAPAQMISSNGDVVCDLATGAEVWRGDRLPPIGENKTFRTKLGDSGLVCYGATRHVSAFSLGARAPIVHREYLRDSTSSSKVVGSIYYEVSYLGVTAWELS